MEETNTKFEANGKAYEVKYSFKRIEMYEASHRPVMASFAQNGGSFGLAELRDLVAYGLMAEGGGYVSPNQGRTMAESLIDENGYLAVFQTVAAALERDCGFFFKTQSA